MQTDGRCEPAGQEGKPADGGGIRARVARGIASALARLGSTVAAARDALASPGAGGTDDRDATEKRERDANGDAADTEIAPREGPSVAAAGPELTASQSDGRLRVADDGDDGAYVESDTWVEIER
jgi:hypothetical protein